VAQVVEEQAEPSQTAERALRRSPRSRAKLHETRLTPAIALALLLAAPPARAWIPEPERAWGAIAQTNAASGRGRSLDLAVALVGADGAVAATGRLRLEPDGRSRLDLELGGNASETHERAGLEYRVTRNGQRADKAPRLLPPLALLQETSAMGVADALRAIGGNPAQVDLGIEGKHDCWVLGGRDPGPFEASNRPSLWVDQEAQQPVRIDDASGTQYRLGDPVSRDGVRFPSRIEVSAPGWPIWRIEIQSPAAKPARLE
jgi:hypothetical protein